jgi:hypothetical protein
VLVHDPQEEESDYAIPCRQHGAVGN